MGRGCCPGVSSLYCGKHVIYGDGANLVNVSAWGTEALDRLGRHRAYAQRWGHRRGHAPLPAPPWRFTAVIGVFRSEVSALAAERFVQESLPSLTGMTFASDADAYTTGRAVGANGAADGFAVYLMMR